MRHAVAVHSVLESRRASSFISFNSLLPRQIRACASNTFLLTSLYAAMILRLETLISTPVEFGSWREITRWDGLGELPQRTRRGHAVWRLQAVRVGPRARPRIGLFLPRKQVYLHHRRGLTL